MSLEDIQKKLMLSLLQKGSSGSTIMTSSDKIPAFNVENPVDPTGCGDAYRAGIAYGIVSNGLGEERQVGICPCLIKSQL